MPKEYLGDSVYADTDEMGQLVLMTENGMPSDPSNIIFLEASVVRALVSFAKRNRVISSEEEL